MPIDRDASSLYPPFAELTRRFEDAWNRNHPEAPTGRFEGFRTFERQAELYAMGRTAISTSPCHHDGKSWVIGTCPKHPLGGIVTNAPPGYSFHNYGLAEDRVFDAYPVRPGLQPTWDGKYPWDAMGEAIGRHRCGSEPASWANGERKDRLVGLLGQIQWDLHDRYDTRPWGTVDKGRSP